MKRWKTTITVVLLVFVTVTVGVIVAQEIGKAGGSASVASAALDPSTDSIASQEQTTEAPAAVEPSPSTVESAVPGTDEQTESVPPEDRCEVLAIYFHNTHRCTTCLKIENGARQVVDSAFSEEIEFGTLTWSAVNMEAQPEYISRYGLAAPSLVLVRTVNNVEQEWIVLDDTWSLIRSPDRFDAYILGSITSYLEACP